MKYLVNAREMQRCDRITIEEYGVPGLVLMERAALAVADSVMDGEFCTDKVLAVCGSGNNGGDGFAAARILMERNVEIAVLFVGKEESMSHTDVGKPPIHPPFLPQNQHQPSECTILSQATA